MLVPSSFTFRVELLLQAARIEYQQADLLRFVRRHWPEIAVENDAVRWAERFAATLPAQDVAASA